MIVRMLVRQILIVLVGLTIGYLLGWRRGRNLLHWLLTGDCRMCIWHPVWGFFAHKDCLVHSVLKIVWPMEVPVKSIALWTDTDPPLYVSCFYIVERDSARRHLTLETYYREHLVTWLGRNTCVRFLLSADPVDRFYGALPGKFSGKMMSVSPFASYEECSPLKLMLEEVPDERLWPWHEYCYCGIGSFLQDRLRCR